MSMSAVPADMSSVEPSYRILRLLCANTVGMVSFLAAYAIAREPGVAVIAGVVLGVVGYAASGILVDYASSGPNV